MKVWLPKVNSPWGIVVKPQSDNVYKDIINFIDGPEGKRQFLSNYFFDGINPITFMNANGREQSPAGFEPTKLNGTISVKRSDYPDYTFETFLNADYLPILNDAGDFIYWYQIKALIDKNSTIEYEIELDVFLTWWDQIEIDGNVFINRGHVNRVDDNLKFTIDYNSPGFGKDYPEVKGLKNVNNIYQFNHESKESFENYFNDLGKDNMWLYVFRKEADTTKWPTIITGYTENGNKQVKYPYSISVAPLNPIKIPTATTDGVLPPSRTNPDYYSWSGIDVLGDSINDANVAKIVISQFNPINWLSSEGWVNVDGVWCFVVEIGIIKTVPLANLNIIAKGVNDGFDTKITDFNPFIKYLDYQIAKQFNLYSLNIGDIIKYNLTNEYTPTNELFAYGKNSRNITIIQQGVKDYSYTIPNWLYGYDSITFELSVNVDVANFMEYFRLVSPAINVINYEGYGGENQLEIAYANDNFEEYKRNQKGSWWMNNMNLFLGAGAATGALKGGSMFAGFAAAEGSIRSISTRMNLHSQPDQPQGTGFLTLLLDATNIYSLKRIAVLNEPIGNLFQQYASDVYKNGVEINQLINFNSFKATRKYFNVVQCEGIFSKIKNIRLGSSVKQLISSSFENGLRLWHYRDWDSFKGILDYDNENEEMNETD